MEKSLHRINILPYACSKLEWINIIIKIAMANFYQCSLRIRQEYEVKKPICDIYCSNKMI